MRKFKVTMKVDSLTLKASRFEIHAGGVLVLFQASVAVYAFAPGTWTSVEEVA